MEEFAAKWDQLKSLFIPQIHHCLAKAWTMEVCRRGGGCEEGEGELGTVEGGVNSPPDTGIVV